MGQVQVIDEARLTVIAGDKQGWRPGEGAQGRVLYIYGYKVQVCATGPPGPGCPKGTHCVSGKW